MKWVKTCLCLFYSWCYICGILTLSYSFEKIIIHTYSFISSCTKEEEPINEACPEIYMPVCGPDGTQYDNECFARLEGVTVYTGCGLTG